MKIGLTQRVIYHKGRAYDSIEHGWYRYLKDHTLITVANRVDQDFDALADSLDSLIITGGDDSSLRRTVELKLAGAMMKQLKPVVGICHGCFLLVDVLGGEVKETNGHMDKDHFVNYFGEPIIVNSYHNLAIKQLHKTGTALVQDEQGDCEAWIEGILAGVVWHPERMTIPWLPSEIQNLLKI